ncbi:MAG: hypothetical protein Q7R22_003205 [Verrucomicrobiota bacterium JB025]|nr:hypothetical protein [Verrucomicrobiota bacterium JB025]
MVDFIFEHFGILAIIGVAFASWLKARKEAKELAEFEEEARREIIEQPGEPVWQFPQPSVPPPLRDVPAEPAPAEYLPPPLTPPPLEQPKPSFLDDDVYDEVEAVLERQRELEKSLRKIKAAKQAKLADEPNRDIHHQSQRQQTKLSPLSAALQDQRQLRRAIILREVLGAPVGLRH